MSINIWRTVHLLLLLFFIIILNLQRNGCYSQAPGKTVPPALFKLSIIHMNDFHSRFEGINKWSWPCDRKVDEQCYGGLPRTLTLARQLKSQYPNSIFVNTGDNYQGTIWYNIFKWEAIVHFFDMLPYDVMTVGNHDFDDGIAGLVPFLKHSRAPVVLSNIITDNEPTLQGLLRKSHIIEIGGRKIGFIGVIFQSVSKRSKTEKAQFSNEELSINSEANNLKTQGVNIIIVLSHCGIHIDRKLAANCPNIDVIVGAHSHTFLYSGPTPPLYDIPKDQYPIVVRQKNSKRTVLIVQAFAFSKYLGHLLVSFNTNGEIQSWSGNPILLDETIEEDRDMLASLVPYKKIVDTRSAEVIGETQYPLINDCDKGECALGNMIADAMVGSFINRGEGDDWTYAAIAVEYVRFIKKSIGRGKITYGDLALTLQLGDTWDVIEVQGKHLRSALEESFSTLCWHGQKKYRSNLVWSGMDVVYDTSTNVGPKVVDVKVRCQKCPQPIYEDLKDFDWYRIVVSGFMANKGGDSNLANAHRNHLKGLRDIDQCIQFFRMIGGPWQYRRDNRLYFCDRKKDKCCGKNYRSYLPRHSIFND